ncbi:hypothetical protein SH501x_002357 [Pirellulaceae bacterium SH501]
MSLVGIPLVRSRNLPGCMIVALLLVTGWGIPSQAQSDDAPEPTANEPSSTKPAFSNPLSKLFARKPAEESDEPTKQSRPSGGLKPGSTFFRNNRSKPAATPASTAPETETRGGLLVPLKSFTNRVFRQNDEPQDDSDTRPAPTPPSQPLVEEQNRPFREPFKNLPRPRFANNREESDIELEEVTIPEPASRPTAKPSASPLEIPPPVVSRSSPNTNAPREGYEGFAPYNGATKSEQLASPDLDKPVVSKPFKSPAANNNSSDSRLPANNSSRRSSERTQPPAATNSDAQSDSDDTPSLLDLSSESSTPKRSSTANLRTATTAPRSTPSASPATNRPIETAKPDDLEVPRVITSRTSNTKVTGQPISSRNSATKDSRPSTTDPESNLTTPTTLPAPPSRLSTESEPVSAPKSSGVKTSSVDTRAFKSALGSMQLPGVRVSVQGPESLLVGQDSTFEILAKNEGAIDLNGLLLRITVPASVEIGQMIATNGQAQSENAPEENAIGWEIPKLQAGTQVNLRLSLRTNKPEHFAMGIEWTAVPQSQEYSIRVQQPQLDVALEGPSEAEFGSPQNYRLRIRNPGSAVAKDVEVVLQAGSYGSNQSKIGDIQPGAERVIDVELLFEQSGSIPVIAIARSETSKLEAKGDIQVKVKQAALEAAWTGPTEFYQGTAADYRIVVTNRGDIVALNTDCHLKLPDGAMPASLPAGAIRKGNTIHWEIKRLEPNESVAFPIGLSMNETGENALEFSADCKNSLPLNSTYKTLIDSIVDLKLSVKDPIAPAPVGQPVVYEIEIYNRGSKAATGVAVLAQFSEGIEPVRYEGAEGRILPGQVLFEPIGVVEAGAKVTLRVFAEAAEQGVHRFRAEVKCDSGEANLLQEESTRFLASGSSGSEKQ